MLGMMLPPVVRATLPPSSGTLLKFNAELGGESSALESIMNYHAERAKSLQQTSKKYIKSTYVDQDEAYSRRL
jgi:hypothetical protein